MAEAKIALHALTAGLVLDRSVFVGQTVVEMQSTLVAIRSAPKKSITVIENGATFFTVANMLDLIKADDPAYKLIAEKAKATLRDEDVTAIKAAEAAKKAIEAIMVPPIPPYLFVSVPPGWTVETYLNIGKLTVKRRRINPTGDRTGYSISLTQLKRVWNVASKRWVTNTTGAPMADVRAEGYTRTAFFFKLKVDIGCQVVRRYELEQLALHLGWDFPPSK